MHAVSKIDPAAAQTPRLYQPHSTGFRRATYVDRAMGSVHMGTGICFLDAGGAIQPHLHSFEESFYILEGTVDVQIGEKTHTLGPGNFAYVPVPMTWEVVTFIYKGVDRAERFTVFYKDDRLPQEHIVTKGLQKIYLT